MAVGGAAEGKEGGGGVRGVPPLPAALLPPAPRPSPPAPPDTPPPALSLVPLRTALPCTSASRRARRLTPAARFLLLGELEEEGAGRELWVVAVALVPHVGGVHEHVHAPSHSFSASHIIMQTASTSQSGKSSSWFTTRARYSSVWMPVRLCWKPGLTAKAMRVWLLASSHPPFRARPGPHSANSSNGNSSSSSWSSASASLGGASWRGAAMEEAWAWWMTPRALTIWSTTPLSSPGIASSDFIIRFAGCPRPQATRLAGVDRVVV